MDNRDTRAQVCYRVRFFLIFALFIPLQLHSQTPANPIQPGPPGSDALPFLTELFSRYAHATTYDLEFTEERQLTGEYVRNWNRSLSTAVVGPANQYRFEHHGEFGDALQVSDGKTEWVYFVGLNQYTQQPAPNDGPSKIHTSPSVGLERLVETRSTAHSISSLAKMIQTAKFAPDQDIQIGGETIACVVIDTEGALPGWDAHISVEFTFWIEKKSGLIRKSVSRDHGELSPRNSGSQYNSETVRIYSVAALNPSTFSAGAFTFTPPPTAVLVKQFQDKQTQELAKFVGKPLPPNSVKDSTGKALPLQSFRGQPLLLDLWATWCEPCRESLPDLEKLYAEYKAKGLVLLSLDEDEEPQKATDFWTQNKLPWPNYHLDKLSAVQFPPHGIPYFVLVDPSGNVVFSQTGLDEATLRAAITAVGSPSTPAPQ